MLATTLAGCFVGVLLVQHELGIDNAVTEHLCQTGRHTDCDAVLDSKKSKLFNWLNLPDVVLIWFSSLLLLLTVSFYTGNAIASLEVIALLTACAVPVTLASLYYQWRVVKKWCTLCLLTIAVLWMQAGVMLPELLNIQSWQINTSPILFVLFVASLITTIWLVIVKPLYKEEQKVIGNMYKLQRVKNNSKIFLSLLKAQKEVDVTPFDNEVQIGNEKSTVQIMVACNPYCNPCAKAHVQLDKLCERYNTGLSIRFSCMPGNDEDKRTVAVRYLLDQLSKTDAAHKKKILHDWYEVMDLAKFAIQYPIETGVNITEQLAEHAEWMKECNIRQTPTVFINGYELPKQYEITDLENILRGVVNEIEATYIKI